LRMTNEQGRSAMDVVYPTLFGRRMTEIGGRDEERGSRIQKRDENCEVLLG
jgi:hypothetical protein